MRLPCFKIGHIVIDLASSADTRFLWMPEALAGVHHDDTSIGKCLGTQGIAMVVKRTQEALSAQGFASSRVFARPQNLNGGTLTQTILAARVDAIRLVEPPQDTPAPRLAEWNSVVARAGCIHNLHEIEKTLENLRRGPGVQVHIRLCIEPADAPDQSNLVIPHSQKAYARLTDSLDDSGTRATDRYQSGVTFSLDNPRTLSDPFYATLSNDPCGSDPGSRGTRSDVAHYSLPMGYWNVGATASANGYYQNVVGINRSYVYRGIAETTEFNLSRIVLLNATRKTNLRLEAFQRRSNNHIDDTEVMVPRRVVGGWELGAGHKQPIDDVRMKDSLNYRLGTGDFDTLPTAEELLGEGTLQYDLFVSTPLHMPHGFKTASASRECSLCLTW